MVGPSRRQMAVGGSIIGFLAASIGAGVALKTVRVPEFTSVGLVGEPSAVTQTQNTPTTPAAPETAPTPVNPARATPRNTASPRPTSGAPAPAGTPSRPTTADPPRAGAPASPGERNPPATQNGDRTPTDPPSEDPPDQAPAGQPESPTPPGSVASPDAGAVRALPGDGNVIERGPRNSQGGFHMGDETDATGTMDPGVFSFVYRRYSPQIASCYSNASRAHPVSGVIVMRVRIGTDGHVARTRVVSDTAHAPGLAECVQTSMRSWRYPQPEGGEVEVDYPLRFGGAH